VATSCPLVRVTEPDDGRTVPRVICPETSSGRVDSQLTVTSPYVPSRLTPTCTTSSATHTHTLCLTSLLVCSYSTSRSMSGGPQNRTFGAGYLQVGYPYSCPTNTIKHRSELDVNRNKWEKEF